jgi:hypothetical protein
LLLVLGTVSPASASPIGIDIVSSQYHVWGSIGAGVSTFDANHQLVSSTTVVLPYDITSSNPIDYSNAYTQAFVTSASAGEFFVSTSSSSTLNFIPTADGGEIDLKALFGQTNFANAQADWTFRPLGTTLDATANGPISGLFANGSFLLTDLTTGLVLAQATHFAEFSLDVDPTHLYGLSLTSHSDSHSDAWNYTMSADIRAVPEPGTALLLGLGFVAVRRLVSRRRSDVAA